MCLCVRLGGWSCNNLGMMNIADISTDQKEGSEDKTEVKEAIRVGYSQGTWEPGSQEILDLKRNI